MQLIDKIASLDNRLIDRVSTSLYSRIDAWLAAHPLIHWLISHSLISLIVGFIVMVLIIRILLTIYYSIASTIDRMWLWILRSPFLLLKFLFGWEVKSKNNSPNTTITNYEVTSNPEQLQAILTRLEHIQKQQGQIVRDIAILKERCDPSLSEGVLRNNCGLGVQINAKTPCDNNLPKQRTLGNKPKEIKLQSIKKELPSSIIENEL